MATNEDLQQQLDEMRAEMEALRRQLQRERRDDVSRAPRLMSRRNLLRAAPVAAVGGAVAALAATPAAAASGDPVLLGRTNDAGGGRRTTVTGGTPGSTVSPGSIEALRVQGGTTSDWFSADNVTIGVGTEAQLDVLGNLNNAGLAARFTGGTASGTRSAAGGDCVEMSAVGPGTALVISVLDGDAAVFPSGGASLAATGLHATAQSGDAVQAVADTGSAVAASTTSTTSSTDAVTIDYAGTARALYAKSHNQANLNGTVTGVNEGQGIGVWGEQRNNTGPGIGVVGVGGTQGRGSQFTGGVAQTRLVPSTASTHPTTGKAGDLFVDASVRLWFCTKASSASTAATWKQIA